MADPDRQIPKTRWLKRLRPPSLFALGGVGGEAGPTLWRRFVGPIPEEVPVGAIDLTATILVILAIGWGVTTIVDGLIKRRMRRLDLTAADNLQARTTATKLDVVRRIWVLLGGIITFAGCLLAIPDARQIGISLFASAGVAGIALGLAARPVLGNLVAGLQIAFTQPIRLDDAVVVEGEWGWIEEIGLFYVVIKIWDWRRLVVPLSYFIEKPFQNWTRETASIIGSVFWEVDFTAPVKEMRTKLEELCKRTPLWDGNVVNLQVSDANGRTLTVRGLATARTSPAAWDLRCFLREEMTAWLVECHPGALPRERLEGRFSRPGSEETGAAGGPAPLQETPFRADGSLSGEAGGP